MAAPTFVLPQTPAAYGPAVKHHLDEVRTYWRQAHQLGTPAVVVSRGLAQAMEAMVTTLYHHATAVFATEATAPKVALVALGGLGRREFAPFSDLDIVLVCDQPEAIEPLSHAIFYPLWDARLDVDHAVRSLDDFARLAEDDDKARTAAVDFRPIAGDPTLIAALSERLQHALRSGAARRYAIASVRSWVREGNPQTVYHLQPDIKSGPGGLREVHRLWWLMRLLYKIDSWQELLALGLTDKHGLQALAAGHAMLLNIRLAMHFVAGRHQDQLRFELQDEVAAYLHLPAGPHARLPSDNLLQAFYTHAKAVRGTSSRILELCAEGMAIASPRVPVHELEGFDVFHGALTLRRVDQLIQQPLDCLRIFHVALKHHLPVYVHARTRIVKILREQPPLQLQTDAEATRLFVAILANATDRGTTLEWLYELGLLELMIPEFGAVAGLAQRDLYHVHTVDAHLVMCAKQALSLLSGADTAPLPAEIKHIVARLTRPHVLVLAALMHDIGKGHGHGHSERGAILARQVGTRLGLGEDDIADIEFLVLEHLTLFKISQRRDMQDPALIGQFAATVGSLERLDTLMVLSYADAVTTGPKAWTTWKGDLLRELYQRTRSILLDPLHAPNVDHLVQKKLLAWIALDPPRASACHHFAARVEPRHLVIHRPALLRRHADLLRQAELLGAACSIESDARQRGWELVLVGPDKPGLLANLSGVLAAWGVSVDAAYISGTRDPMPYAIDTFVLREGAERICADRGRAAALCDEMRLAAAGIVAFCDRLKERRRATALQPMAATPVPPRIVYDLDTPVDATVIDVYAPDRVGLLHDLARTFFEMGVSIVMARISTEGDRAIDAFYLVDSQTRLPLTPAAREAIATLLRRVAAISDA